MIVPAIFAKQHEQLIVPCLSSLHLSSCYFHLQPILSLASSSLHLLPWSCASWLEICSFVALALIQCSAVQSAGRPHTSCFLAFNLLLKVLEVIHYVVKTAYLHHMSQET